MSAADCLARHVRRVVQRFGTTPFRDLAIRIVLDGWQAEGETFSVTVAGTPTPIAYGIQMVDCE